MNQHTKPAALEQLYQIMAQERQAMVRAIKEVCDKAWEEELRLREQVAKNVNH